jgi:PAS domain S-box-containing protein
MDNSQPTKQDLFEQFMENSPIYVFFKDDQIRAIQLSHNYEKMLGKSLQELLGKTMDDLFPSDLAKSMIADDKLILEEGKPKTVEEEFNGRVYTTTKFPILNKGKRPYLAGYSIDITERKLNEDKIRYQAGLLEHVSDAIIAIDMKYNIRYWNKAAERQYGWTASEVIGHPLEKFIITDYPGGSLDDILQGVAQEGFWKGEVTQNRRDGVRIPIMSTLSVLKNDAHQPCGFIAVNHDLTERQKNKSEVHNSRQMLQTVLDTIPAAVFWKDRDSLYLGGNRTWLNSAGLISSEDVVGKSDWELPWDEKQARAFRENDKRIMESGLSEYNIVEPYVRADGTRAWAKTNKVPLRDVDGNIMGILGTYEDITERIQAETLLRESQKKFQALVETTGDFIWEMDSRGSYTYCSPQLERLWGLHPEEMLGKTPFDLLPPEDRIQAIKGFSALFESASPFKNMEMRSLDGSGKVRFIEISGVPFFDSEGKLSGYRGITRDITDRKRMEEELQKAQKLESLGLLAGGIAHDFNNLIGGIFGYIEMANEESKDSGVTSYLLKALNTIDRARALTQQLLTFAKGGAPIQEIGHLFPFVKETVNFALSGSNVSCNFDVPKDLWACNFDKNQIGQVIDNIIINAQQAMPDGGTIALTVRNITLAKKDHPLLAKGNYVMISVKDSGVGISKELISRIFDPFFTTKAKGHGLGLATCYSIINRHGGCIDVESEPGKGSSFHVYLPASMESASSARKESSKKHKGSGTILVMDDEEVMRDTIGDMLETLGYSVVSKENGKDAIDFFASETKAGRKITCMFFDLTVPGGMGGKAAIEEIRKSNKDIPAFVISGYAEDPVMKSPAEYGFTASICKPFRISDLSEMLNNHVMPIK